MNFSAFSSPLIEPLESRIAPASLINAQTVHYTDYDGDMVKLKISKPLFTSEDAANAVLKFNTGTVNGSTATQQQLLVIDLSPFAAGGIDADELSITVKVLSSLEGNGKVNVGYIKAGTEGSQPNTFTPMFDLGRVKIEGDLTKLDAGDAFSDLAVAKIDVLSMGVFDANDSRYDELLKDSDNNDSTTSLIPGVRSNIFGPLGELRVAGDLASSVIRVFGAQFGNIGSIKVGGALGGENNLVDGGGGAIYFTGNLDRAVFGSIEGRNKTGSNNDSSGVIEGSGSSLTEAFQSTINKLVVKGDVIGGAGTNSGIILASIIRDLDIRGELQGGAGNNSGTVSLSKNAGSIHIGAGVTGGSGDSSGTIRVDGRIGSLDIEGNVTGGGDVDVPNKNSSGRIAADLIKELNISGSLIGGGGDFSGSVTVRKFNEATIGGDIKGGSGQFSGFFTTDRTRALDFLETSNFSFSENSGRLRIGGDIEGGPEAENEATILGGESAGSVLLGGNIKNVKIGGSIVGGNFGEDNNGVVDTLVGNGYFEAQKIQKMTVAGSLIAGNNVEAAENKLLNCGAIRSATKIGELTILGGVFGDRSGSIVEVAAVISAGSEIGTLRIDGNVLGAQILAGVSTTGAVLTADAKIDRVFVGQIMDLTSIAAGVGTGGDGFYGTEDDVLFTANDSPDVISKIGQITVRGGMGSGSVAAHFGFVAERINQVEIPGEVISLSPGTKDVVPLVTTNGTTVREI